MRLGEQVAARDAAVFVARAPELALLTGLLDDASPHRLAFLTGPAGAGKSALVRELARRAVGRTVTTYDAREAAGDPHRLAEVLAGAAGADRPLLVVDSAEELGADEARLREGLGALPAQARVVVVTRGDLERAWWRSAWGASILRVPVAPLEAGAADALLAARGVRDPAERDAVVAWAEGHPLSLTLAVAAREARGRALDAADLAALEHDLLDHLTSGRLVGPDLVGRDRLVLAVAALAPAVDADLVAAALPGADGAAAEAWLRTLPFAERVGHRIALHQRVRRILATQLRAAEPDLERGLRLRIIDHLAEVAGAGRPQLVLDIREVLAPPQDRGITPSRALASPWSVHAADPADAPEVADALAATDPAYASWVTSWVVGAPGQVLLVRGGDGRLAAVTTWLTPGVRPVVLAALAEDPVVRRWLPWVADRDRAGRALLQPVTEILPGHDPAELGAVVLTSVVQRCGLANFRRWLVPSRPPAPDPAHCGGVRTPALDLRLGSVLLPVHVIDYGERGVIPALREEAHRSLGGAVPGPRARPAVVPGTGSPAVEPVEPVEPVEAVRRALRDAHDPVALAASPLARGTGVAARAAGVRRLLDEAVDAAFGEGAEAEVRRAVLRLGYLAPDHDHARAMRALHLSRTTYFRRLREATDRLAAWIGAAGGRS